ncbi:MAG: hypothetical protein LBU32_19425 [Clostridiales bacterium]|nr:hypothetical protein [Clostridiales bacterium]
MNVYIRACELDYTDLHMKAPVLELDCTAARNAVISLTLKVDNQASLWAHLTATLYIEV